MTNPLHSRLNGVHMHLPTRLRKHIEGMIRALHDLLLVTNAKLLKRGSQFCYVLELEDAILRAYDLVGWRARDMAAEMQWTCRWWKGVHVSR
jgi:hypothetical protein